MSDVSIPRGPADWATVLLVPFRATLKGLSLFQLGYRQAVLAAKLLDLSDAELAKRGLTREQIPHFVASSAS